MILILFLKDCWLTAGKWNACDLSGERRNSENEAYLKFERTKNIINKGHNHVIVQVVVENNEK